MAVKSPSKNALVPADAAAASQALVAYTDYEQFAGDGYQNQNSEDVAIPFMDILHYQCPQLDTIEGAAPGLIINKATNQLYKELTFIPAVTMHQYLEWIKLDEGGGLVATYELDHDIVKQARAVKAFGKWDMPNGHELVETYSVYGVAVDGEGSPTPAVISFSSTRIKAYKQWMAFARGQLGRRADGSQFQMPLYAYQWVLTSEKQEKKPYKWFTWKTAFKGGSAATALLKPSDPLFQLAKATLDNVMTGKVKADLSQAQQVDDGGKGGAATADGAPF